MIKSMKLVSVPVSDQQRALDFFTTKLGFRVVTDQPFDDKQRWIELGVGRNGTSLALFTPPEHKDRIGGLHRHLLRRRRREGDVPRAEGQGREDRAGAGRGRLGHVRDLRRSRRQHLRLGIR
jgi:catechol 2,3-dioxygenase-like lactoylglutathione lyase family enzyme